jgi:hypothetical protein
MSVGDFHQQLLLRLDHGFIYSSSIQFGDHLATDYGLSVELAETIETVG